MIAFTAEKLGQSHRKNWLINRKKLESIRYNKMSKRAQKTGQTHFIDRFLPAAAMALKAVNLYERGIRNALSLEVNQHDLSFSNLPPAFDGYRILHLTDLHLDTLPGIEHVICEKIAALEYDLCVITGDYRKLTIGSFEKVIAPLEKVINCTNAKDGVVAILGNHDTHEIVPLLEEMNATVLTNETIHIQKGLEEITITGVDDPHYYFSGQAVAALCTPEEGFKIALIHSPELYEEAAENGYNLYLCGHTHAGQICLPRGTPILRNLKKGHHLYRGLWQHGGMRGYTSAGCGVSGLPARFFSRGEIALFTLHKEVNNCDLE